MTAIVNIQAQSNANLNLKTRTRLKMSGEYIDFSTYSALMQVRERKNGYVILATLSSDKEAYESGEVDGLITLSSDGYIEFNLPVTAIRDKINYGSRYYDVVLTRSDNTELRFMEGNFNVDTSTTIKAGS